MTPPDPETPLHMALESKDEEPPPILGSWNRLYLILVGALVVQLILYWLLTVWAQ
ncbi:MAG: hypothetical protein ACFB9M_11075 [Myxococcota bacterium]